jgi:hypothetical protein
LVHKNQKNKMLLKIFMLTFQSIAGSGTLQHIPDFINGEWKNRQPVFRLSDEF